ncbi:MAG TPA: hypothetical protein VF128_10740 [Gemmatimonadaceae bacterium]
MNRTLASLVLAALVAACSSEAPVAPRVLTSIPLTARPTPQTLYTYTLSGGLQSNVGHPFSSLAATGTPFSGNISGDPVYLDLPASAGGDPAICNQDGSGLAPAIGDWEGYVGTWKGAFTISPKKGKDLTYSVTYNATREDGTGFIWLVIKGGVLSNGNLVFTNVRGLVSEFSSPIERTVGPFDNRDRCLTFTITATP